MKKWTNTNTKRRLLSLALSIVMVLSLLPAGALAEEPVLDEPVQEELVQEELVQEELVQEPKTETCTHGNDPAVCEACASEARVAAVQAQIDALPRDVTAETKEAAQSALSAVDTAKSALTESEQAQLDMTRYTALTQKLAALESPAPSATGDTTEKTAKVISAWAWIDEEEYLDEETGGLALPGASEEMPAYFVDVVTFLPYEITATVDGVEETLTIDWVCDNYPEDGAYEGEYTFTATLPEGYALDEGVKALTVPVLLGGIKRYATGISYMTWDGSQKKLVSATCDSATEVTGSADDVTWRTGWYVVNQDVTFGSMMKPVAVRAEGDIHLILADGVTCTIYGRLEVNSSDEESDSLTIYGQSGQSGRLDVQNVSHYSCATDGEADGCSDPTNKTNMYLAYSAAIGSKCKAPETGEYASYDTKITINGGNVTASFVAYNHKTDVTGTPSLCWAAAIGSGPFANATITINGGTVNGNNPHVGAGIGAGYYSDGTVVINGGTVEGGSASGAGIGGGGGSSKKTATITINGGKVTGTSEAGAGIGSAGCGDNQGGSYAKIYIHGGDVTGDSSRGAGIGSGNKSNTAYIEINDGTVTGDGGEGAGIGSGASAYQSTIKITGGIVKAKAGKGAAIGSGNEAKNDSTKITINGGDIFASTEISNSSGAAIGGSFSGNKVSKIEIRNAKVVAKAGKGSPGIGDGSVTISNSTVNAYGGQLAAGIGSRQGVNSSPITIESGNVTAVGGSGGAAGIGTGNFYSFSSSAMGKITIQGGTVNAQGTDGAAGIGGGSRVMVNRDNIVISGGTVYALRGRGPVMNEKELYQAFDIGDGEIPVSQNAGLSNCRFTLPENGTAWVYLESDNNRKSIAATSGVILEKKQSDDGYETCTVYGTQSLSADYPIARGRSMTVKSGATLNTGNYGIYVQNGGTLTRSGTVNGNVYYPLTLTDCTASGNTSTYGDSNDLFGKEGANISLTPTLPSGYKFQSWETTPANLITSGSSFKMPNQATTVKAKGTQVLWITQQPEPTTTIIYGDKAILSVTAQNSSGGTDGITYQWYKGTEKLPNETSKTLSLRYLDASTQPYSFYCEVSCSGVSINSNTATVTVNKAQASVTIDSDPSKTYDGTPVATSYTVSGSGSPKIEYKLQSETVNAYTETPPTDAGSYTVRVTMSENQNYKGASATKDFTISKATDNAWRTAPSVAGFTYGDTVTNPVKYQALYGDDDVVVTYKKQGTQDTPSTTVPKDAGTYDVTVTLEETNNYGPKLEATNLTLTIAKAASSVTTAPTDAQSLYTGGNVPLVTAGTAEGGTMHYSLDGQNWSNDIPKATDWKTYTVYYRVAGDNNHNDTEAKSLTAEIVPFKVPETQAAVGITYGQDAALSVNPNTNLPDEISYQWYQGTGSEGDVELSGETANKLTIDKPNAGTYSYICKITCGDYFKYSTVPVVVTPAEVKDVDLSDFWAEGGERKIAQGESVQLTNPSSRLLTKYTTTTTYPTGMQVFKLDEKNQPVEIPELSNLLQYSGCSIRINGKPGIRMITSLTKQAKAALKKGELAGYTLEEYGTVVAWSKELGNNPLTLSTGSSNYAYRKGVSDPVFANVGDRTQYTNVLVWDSLPDEKYAKDIAMRPYIILSKDGETVTLYGGTVSRSIGYVAQQNADTFPKGSAGYKYVHDIIDRVNKLTNNSQQS